MMKSGTCWIVLAAAVLAGCGGGHPGASAPAPAAPQSLVAGPTSVFGLSSVAYSGKRANYTITLSNGSVTIKDDVGTGGTATYVGLKRIYFSDFAVAYDTDGIGGQMYRLYKAAFDRQPDLAGLGHQIAAVEASGLSVVQVAQNFAASPEYLQKYGNTTNTQFVTQLYLNALHRAPEPAGLAFHVGYLDASLISRAQLLANFSESAENRSQVAAEIQDGITYTPYQLPTITSVPAAPTLNGATGGNASAVVSFTAPTMTGNLAITGYTATCSAASGIRTASGAGSPLTVTGLANGTQYACAVAATNLAGTGAASGSATVTPALTAASGTGQYFCSHSANVFNATINLTSMVTASCTSTLRTLTGNGVPDHAPGTFPNSSNPNAIKAVNFTFRTSLSPSVAAANTAVSHVVGYVNNGVKLDPSTAESYQNAGVWKIEALNQSYFAFGVDSSNAHVQPDGAYHYHGMPEGYITRQGKGTAMTLVGFALDGFPIYARYGYSDALNASSTTRKINASYRLKTSPSAGRPSTSAVPMGTFTQDYEYVQGLGDLDDCNGRFGVTPEFPSGIYHYYITEGYPYIQRCLKGSASAQ
jgi:hypothetical protein